MDAARTGARSARERGQVLVIFVLALVALMAAAGLAVDMGRFYSERRFLQNAADAAALAAANALIRGGTIADARADANTVLTRNFSIPPNGITPNLPPAAGSEVYTSGHAGSASYLIDGILITGGDVRVAIRNTIPYTFGRVVGLNQNSITARARVKLAGNLMPIAVRHFVNAPGPTSGATAPCPGNQSNFMDFFSTANTSCLGTDANGSLRTDPNSGAAFDSSSPGSDPANHGPVVAILGQGAQADNPADFRGFIALDIRNYATSTSQLYFNGVTAGMTENTLKGMESNWILTGGYPGPAFPSIVSPPDPNDEVAAMSGNSTGIAIDAVGNRFQAGDELLVAVYSGIVNAVPDFALAAPAQVLVPTTGTVATVGSLKVSRNASFSSQVTLSTIVDTLDPANPIVLGTILGGANAITYSVNPVSPATGSGTNVLMTNLTSSGAADGVYVMWVRGEAGSPYLTVKRVPVALVVGSVTRNFTMTSDVQAQTPATPGGSVTFNLTLTNSPVASTNFGGPVTLSVDGPLPAGVGAVSLGSTSVTPSALGTSTTLTINTGTMAAGEYEFDVRATGMNGDSTPRPVTHVIPVFVDIPPLLTGNNPTYIDIQGFAVVRIASIKSNAITGYAISPVIPDMNDSRLRRGQVARLSPWN